MKNKAKDDLQNRYSKRYLEYCKANGFENDPEGMRAHDKQKYGAKGMTGFICWHLAQGVNREYWMYGRSSGASATVAASVPAMRRSSANDEREKDMKREQSLFCDERLFDVGQKTNL